MKFIFFGPSKEIDLLTQKFDKNSFSIHEKVEEVLSKVNEGECLVFINFDFNAEHGMQLNDELIKIPKIKRIIYSKTRNLKEEKIKADEYIFGPLNKAKFEAAYEEVMGGKTLSAFTVESKTDPNKNIEDAFNAAFSSATEVPIAKEETSAEQPSPESPPVATSGADVKDEESDILFSVPGMEIPASTESMEAEKPSETPPQEPAATSVPDIGLSLDDGNQPATPMEDVAGPGDLEIPTLDEGMPSLELGGADDIVAAPPDQGLDIDMEASDATVVQPSPKPQVDAAGMESAKESEIQKTIETPPKPPVTLDVASDPSMKFVAAEEVPPKVEEESKEFKFNRPTSVTSSSEILAKPVQEAPVTEVSSHEKPPITAKVSDESVIKLESIIRALREERDSLLKEIKDNQEAKGRFMSENLNLEANLEELKVELAIIKKKNEEEFHEDVFERRILKEKLSVSEEKYKMLQKDFEILNQKAKIDNSKVLQREKELENQLELLSLDSQNQILNRDKKISELSREKDAMVFNMENLVSREKKLRQEKIEIEEKLNKIMRTMRNSIEFLETEIQGNKELFKELKK